MKRNLESEYASYSVNYSFTITLRPRIYRKEPEIQFDNTYDKIFELLYSITEKFTLIAECTKAFNIHYHGVIKFPMPFKIKSFHSLFRNDDTIGFVNLKQIDNYEGWIEYIQKEFKEFVEEVGRRPIVYDALNIFGPEFKSTYCWYWDEILESEK